MLAIKKRGMSCAILLCWLLACGCAPPGPRALLKGQRLIREGRYDQAIESLQAATRLLPKNAQAYNHLGLALHGNKQFGPALAAYQKALGLDHKLAAAHYNLGSLLLEQNDAAAAIEQLTTYTLLQPNSMDGWLKLGNAQLRAHKFDPAEKSFKTALTLRPRDPEILNGLGIIQLQRRRTQDALNYFNLALAQNANYGPAILNLAVLNQQNLNNRRGALEKYRQYLSLQPRPPNFEAVSALAAHLDTELNPPPAHSAQINPLPPPAVKSNFAVVAPRVASNHPATVGATIVARTNPSVAPSVPPKIVAQTNQINTNPFVALTKPVTPEPPKLLPPATSKPPAITNKAVAVADKPPEIEVTRVAEELVVKPPEEILVVRPPLFTPRAPQIPAVNPTNPAALVINKSETKPDKRSLLSRLNPFGGKPKSGSREKTPISLPDETETPGAVVAAKPTNVIVASLAAPPPPAFARYAYLSPPKPLAGNRREAERFFGEAIKAQQGGKPALALATYQKATQLDGAYFEAYYNQGLVAYGMGNWKESLRDYEHALAIRPGSMDARYNFALALQRANYPLDAADELLEILNETPAETRAHLLLANLYARQLAQPKLARQHYSKVLEADPHHPKAAEIRYWLVANP